MIPVARDTQRAIHPGPGSSAKAAWARSYRATDQAARAHVAIKFLKDSGNDEENSDRISSRGPDTRQAGCTTGSCGCVTLANQKGITFWSWRRLTVQSFSCRWRNLLLEDRLRICGQVAEASITHTSRA